MKSMTIPTLSTTHHKFTRLGLLFVFLLMTVVALAQDPKKDWKSEGEIQDVSIEIVVDRQIAVPKALRNYDKIPPRPAETIVPPITYEFQSFSFKAPQVSPLIKPLKLKTEGKEDVYGGYLRLGYGNYSSPLVEGYFNSRRDKNKLLGAQVYHNSSGRGPVDKRNSGNGASGVRLFANSFSDNVALSGDLAFENRTTHFYGYPEGEEVDRDTIKQAYTIFKLFGSVANSKNSNLKYTLGAGFSYLTDKYKARETEVDLEFVSSYDLKDESKINVKAGYIIISRKDEGVEAKPRNLFSLAPNYEFTPIENLKLQIGFIAAFENDTIDSQSSHLYPDLKVTYPINPSIDFVAYLTGGMEKVSLQSLSNENMWLAPNIGIFHTNKSADLGLGVNARLGNQVAVHGGLSVATLKNLYFFRNLEDDPSKFFTEYDKGVTKRTNLYAALSYAQSEVAKFLLRGDFYGYATDEVSEAWHRPKYKLTVNGSYNLYDKIVFTADLIAQGGMKAYDPTAGKTVTLDGAFDLNFKTEYLFSKKFSAFAQFNNITSSKYPIYLNYPVRGFQVIGGITWSF